MSESPGMSARENFLIGYREWASRRARVSAQEDSGSPPHGDAWQSSDDTAVELLGEAAELLQGLSSCLPEGWHPLGPEDTLTIPAHNRIQALLDSEVNCYRTHRERIARLSLVDVLSIIRLHFPTAAFLRIDATDQDLSGSLIACEDDVLDATDAALYDDQGSDEEPWGDALWGPLSNLDDSTEEVWKPFVVTNPVRPDDRRLDLAAIEAAVPSLLAGMVMTAEATTDRDCSAP